MPEKKSHPETSGHYEHTPADATDSALAQFLIQHIEHPCQVEVAPSKFQDIRYFYLEEARRALDKMTNPEAKRLLQEKIDYYTKGE